MKQDFEYWIKVGDGEWIKVDQKIFAERQEQALGESISPLSAFVGGTPYIQGQRVVSNSSLKEFDWTPDFRDAILMARAPTHTAAAA